MELREVKIPNEPSRQDQFITATVIIPLRIIEKLEMAYFCESNACSIILCIAHVKYMAFFYHDTAQRCCAIGMTIYELDGTVGTTRESVRGPGRGYCWRSVSRRRALTPTASLPGY